MPGPWIEGSSNEGWIKNQVYEPGLLLEIRGYDTAKKPQGQILIEVIKGGEPKEHKSRLEFNILAASDPDLNWWMKRGPGKALNRKATLHLYVEVQSVSVVKQDLVRMRYSTLTLSGRST